MGFVREKTVPVQCQYSTLIDREWWERDLHEYGCPILMHSFVDVSSLFGMATHESVGGRERGREGKGEGRRGGIRNGKRCDSVLCYWIAIMKNKTSR